MRAAEAAQYQKLTIAGEPLSKKDSRMLVFNVKNCVDAEK